MKTTLNQIRQKSPCIEGWRKLLAHLGKQRADDEPLTITQIIDSNGIEDALWCLRAVKGRDRELRLYAVWCARQVQHLTTDPRSLAALDIAERFANGEVTKADLAAARAAAWDAAMNNAEEDAAWAAAWDAEGAAVWAAARDAAWNAAKAATEDGIGTAARDAAWDAARSAQENRLRELCAECESGVTA